MTDATELTLEDDAFLPSSTDEPAMTPFAELSRLMVVAIRTDRGNSLMWTAQTEPNGPWSGNWAAINDKPYDRLATGCTHDGRVALVAQTEGINPDIEYIAETPNSTDDKHWIAPVSLGMPSGVTQVSQLGMTVNAGGRIAAFAVADRTVYWAFQNPDKVVETTVEQIPPGQSEPIKVTVYESAPPDKPWSDWQALPGSDVASLVVTNNAGGRVMLIANIGPEGQEALAVNQQKVDNAFDISNWTGWTTITDETSGTPGGVPAAVLDRQDAVNIFMIGDETNIMQIRQDPPGSETWSGWARMGVLDGAMVSVSASFNAANHVVLLAADDEGRLYGNLQIDSHFQHWLGWEKVGKVPGLGAAAMNYSADGRLMYAQQDGGSGGLQALPQYTIDSSSWSAGWTVLATGGVGAFGIIRDLTPPTATPT
ncbi:hypothetical protein [Stappia stellulata]|uniref:hypothetical protein n=1 Tax=Stappia stellulata TaxID=71235 RepID=UPI00041BCE1E|nr:hypothetical protein [Stappia stellulata]